MPSGSREWFEEIDRRFFEAAYFAKGTEGAPFGRFLRASELKNCEVLEVGCGMGTHASLIATAGGRLTAVDLTERAVEMTRRRFELFGLGGRIERADAESLPFRDASFDLVWSWGVIHHSSSFERCLSEIRRVLRAGGKLFLMVYYRRSLIYWVHCGLIRGILMGRLIHKPVHQIYVDSMDGAYARTFSKKELLECLRSSFDQIGMTVVGQKAELLPVPRSRLKTTLEKLTPDWLASAILSLWGSMIVVEAVKKPAGQ